MAIAIETLVNLRGLRPASVYGYDGEDAFVLHISTDGVAVLALVDENLGIGPQVCVQEWQALVDVRDNGPDQDEA